MKKIMFIMVGLLLSVVNTYAASGDLTVNGTINAGTGGVKFSDGSVQTTAKTLVWDYTVNGAAVPSATSPTLDGNADGGYEFEFIIYNPTTSSTLCSVYFNGDLLNSNYTGTNYRAGVVPSSAQITDDAYLLAGGTAFWTGTISIDPAGHVMLQALHNDTSNIGNIVGVRKNATVANLTRIDVVPSVTNGIGANSRFRLWKRK